MKKIALMAAFTGALVLAANNRTMYVHHNDEIDIFLFAEIDSLRYSSVSIDSIDMGRPVVQEIWTADTVYRYAIADIDSITFQSPPTIVKSGAIDLAADLAQYVLGVDDGEEFALKLSAATPASLIPQAGDCLYQMSPSDALPSGFAARADMVSVSSSGIDVKCTPIGLEEIFDQLAWDSQAVLTATDDELDADAPMRIGPSQDAGLVSAPWFAAHPKCPDLISGSITLTDVTRDIPAGPAHGQIEGYVAVQPFVTCNTGHYIITKPNGIVLNQMRVNTVVETNVKGSAAGRYEVGKSRTIGSDKKLNLTLPIGLGQSCALTYVGTMKLDGTMGLNYSFSGSYESVVNTEVNYNTNGYASFKSSTTNKILKAPEQMLEASLDGSLALSGSVSLSLVQAGDSLKSMTHTFVYGSSLRGKALFRKSEYAAAAEDNGLYQRITSTGVVCKPVMSVSASAKYQKVTLKGKTTPIKFDSISYYVVPKFTSPSYDKSTSTMSYGVEGVPMEFSNSSLGVAICHDGKFTSWTDSGMAWPASCRQRYDAKVAFDPSKGETIYPTVTMPTGERILASPQYPYVSNCIFPVVTVAESGGVMMTSGATIIGSADDKDKKTTIIVGNMYLCNPQDQKK